MPAERVETLLAAATATTQADGEQIHALSVTVVVELAASLEIGPRDVEILALEHGVLPLRYARNFKTYDRHDQIALLKARVAVIGLGGLGGAVSEALARVGVGRLTLVDGDRFCDHNLNRQALCTEADLESPKARVAAERIRAINTAVDVDARQEYLTADNAAALLDGAQVVIDCLDNIPARFVLEKAARLARIPLVSAAVGGEAGHLMVVYPDDPGLKLIFGPPEAHNTERGAETALGNLPHIVTLMANLEVAECLKILLNRPAIQPGHMLLVDLAAGHFETVDLNV